MKHTSRTGPLRGLARSFKQALGAAALGLLTLSSAHAQFIVSNVVDTPDPVPAGGTVSYAVTVAETNGLPLTGASFTFSVPANSEYAGVGTLPAGVSCSGMTPGQTGPGVLSCTGINLGLNGTAQLPIRVRSLTQGGLSVTVTPTPGGPAQGELTTVNAGADLGLSISGPANASAGSTQTYSFTVNNLGPDASPSSRLSYNVPPGFVPSSTPAGCSLASNVLTCNLGALAVGGSQSINVTGVIGAGGGSTITHTADIAATGGVSDGIDGNNTRSLSTVVAPGSAIAVSKTKSVADPVSVGDNFNFVLNPRYSGDFPAGVAVSDSMPAAFCYAGASTSFNSGAWSCTASSLCPAAAPVISCTHAGGGSAGAEQSLGNITLPVRALATATGAINTANITAPGVPAADGSVATTVIDPVADLRANKSKSWPQNAVPLNVAYNYTLSTTNLGPTPFPASGTITLTDNLPTGLRLNSVTAPAGFSCSSSAGASFPQDGPLTVTCTSSNVALAVNASTAAITLNTQATIESPALVNNLCAAGSGGPVDNNSANNCVGVPVKSQILLDQADLSTLKRVVGIGDSAGNRQLAGQPVTWEIEVVNAGPSTAQNVAVTDVINNAFNASSSDYSLSTVPGAATMGSCSLTTSGTNVSLNNCVISNLPVCTAGTDCPRIRITVRHFGNGTSASEYFQLTNDAFALAPDQGDPSLSNNTSALATAFFESRADVAVGKVANPEPVAAGQRLTYTVTVRNPSATSASRAHGVSITDTLPIGVVFLSSTPSGTGSCTTTPGANATTTAGNRSLVCGWSQINRGSQETVTVVVRALASLSVVGGGSGSISNSVIVSTSTPEIAGGSANNDAMVNSTVSAPSYDLLMNKTDEFDPVNVGDDVVYNLVVTNNGASTVENVVVSDNLPSGAGAPTFVSVTAPAGTSCNTAGVTVGVAGGSLSCTVAFIGGVGATSTGESASATIQIRLRAITKGSHTNQASVRLANAAIDALDANPGNNNDNEPTTFRFKGDVQVVSKAAVRPGTGTLVGTVAPNQSFDWLVQVRNNGPDAADDTSFTDALPAGMVLAGTPVFTITSGVFTPASVSCTGAVGGSSVRCDMTSMPANGTATVRIPVRLSGTPANGTVFTNTASIITTGSGDTNGGADPNAGNNYNSGTATVQGASLSGRVYHDQDADGAFDSGEPGLSAVTIALSGTDNWGQALSLSTTTATDGSFSFNVPPGTYTLTQTQPAAYQPGITRAGGVTGAGSTAGTVPTTGAGVTSGTLGSNANTIQNIVVGAGGTSPNNLFGEVLLSSIAGRVFHDADYDGVSDAGEAGISGVTVSLSGTDMFGNAVSLTTTSAAGTGAYSFSNLQPGSYAVTQPTQPAGYADGGEAAGSAGGSVAVNEQIGSITLNSDITATGYNFGEVLTRVQVKVYEDLDDDGVADPGENGITGVTLRLTGTDAAGGTVNILATPIAGQPGRYEFLNTPPSGPGGYTITETQPTGYAPGKASPNSHPGSAQPGGNSITGVTVAGGASVPLTQGDYLFGELTNGQVRGRVFYDRDGNGTQLLPTETGVATVAITLTGTDALGDPVSLSTTTNADGDYLFDQVPPGSYTITMSRPATYLPGLTSAGTVSGAGSVAGSVPTTGAGISSGPLGSDANVIQTIVLGAPGAGSINNNFALVRAASVAGSVYLDQSPANGVRDLAEQGIAAVTVTLTGTDFYGRSVTHALSTDADGRYLRNDLLPGTYQLDETQPSGVVDGSEALGLVAGVVRGSANPGGVNDRFNGIQLASEEAGTGYDFGEVGGSLGGYVYVDRNNNGLRETGERGIEGVLVTLTGTASDGSVVNLSTRTDATGLFQFTDLLPANASGYTLTETQPSAYSDGLDRAGTVNGSATGLAGNDVIRAIAYGGGSGVNYLFGERAASIAGNVFNDVAGNGVREPGDLPLAGVTLTLTGTDADGLPITRTTVTRADGSYSFDDLPLSDGAGFTITETQPPGYTQGGEKLGNLGGSNPGPNSLLVHLTTPGAQGTGYDFWEQALAPAALSGTVWHDTDSDRLRGGSEPLKGGWTVELLVCPSGGLSCPLADLIVLSSTSTAADGSYRFNNLVPGEFQLRFREPSGQVIGGAWPSDPTLNAAGGAHPTTPGMSPLAMIPVTIGAGANIINQDLPLDPSGIVYDSLTAQPVAGAVVEFIGPPGFDPALHLLGGSASVTTAADGFYQYFLMPSAPAGEYTLKVTPPVGYINSATHLPSQGPLNAATCTAPAGSVDPVLADPCVVSTPFPVLGVPSPYFLSFLFPGGLAQNVVNNHLPLDPGGMSLIELRKTSPKLTVKKGELVPYVITARNTTAARLASIELVDTVPPGFKYVAGSLTVQRLPDGPIEPVLPQLQGRVVTLPARGFAPSESLRISMVLGVGTGVGEGIYVNQVLAQQASTQVLLSNLATASVRVVPDALFDCTDVIGQVYDDRNANGYQDEGEPGVPNVRIATVNGLLISTDAQGRYHIACAAVPKDGTGSNLVLKLDERTLPSGYRVTTENPASERATRGKFVKINFGTTVHRVVRLDLRAEAFEPGATALKPAFAAELPKVLAALSESPSVLRLGYRAASGDAPALAEQRTKALKAELLQAWKRHAESREKALFNLDIEVELLPPSVAP